MTEKEYLNKIGIHSEGIYEKDGSYVVNFMDSREYGKAFTILDDSEDIDIMQSNQLVTEQGSSLMYESISEPYLLNLLADFDSDIYQLIVTEIK